DIASGGAYSGPLVAMAAPMPQATPYPGLTVNGRHPLNIYPYDREGHLLSGVRLFDDRGVPLQGLAKSAPGGAVVRVLPSDVAGALVGNEYPQQIGTIPRAQLGIDGLGGKVPTAPPAVASVF